MEKTNQFTNFYPWTKLQVDSQSSTPTDGVTKEEVQDMITKAVKDFATVEDVRKSVVDKITDAEARQIVSSYTPLVNHNDLLNRFNEHKNLRTSNGVLGHIETDHEKRTGETETPSAEGGFLFYEKGQGSGGGDNPFKSGRVIFLSPVGFSAALLQSYIDTLAEQGGGTIYLDCGLFIFERGVFLKDCVSIIGRGEKQTTCKASEDMEPVQIKRWVWHGAHAFVYENRRCMFVKSRSYRMGELSHMTIDGGIWKEGAYLRTVLSGKSGAEFGIFYEAINYPEITDTLYYGNRPDYYAMNVQANKIDYNHHLYIMGCDVGFYADEHNFGFLFSDSIVIWNGCGMYCHSSDNTYSNIQICNNAIYGCKLLDGNSRISNFKVFWNNNIDVMTLPDEYVDTSYYFDEPWKLFKSRSWDYVTALEFGPRTHGAGIEIQDNWGIPLKIENSDGSVNVSGILIDANAYKGPYPTAKLWCPAIIMNAPNNILEVVFCNYNHNDAIYTTPVEVGSMCVGSKIIYTIANNACENINPLRNGAVASSEYIKVL